MNRLWLLGCLLALPLKHIEVTSAYGFRIHPVTGRYAFHDGIDLRACHDTVFTVTCGIVSGVNYNAISGTYVKITSGDLTVSYCHLSQIFVLPGDSVLSGQPVAITGATGLTTGEHLHLTIRYRGVPIDPLHFLIQLAKKFNQNRKENKQ